MGAPGGADAEVKAVRSGGGSSGPGPHVRIRISSASRSTGVGSSTTATSSSVGVNGAPIGPGGTTATPGGAVSGTVRSTDFRKNSSAVFSSWRTSAIPVGTELGGTLLRSSSSVMACVERDDNVTSVRPMAPV
jgi:hypothetical protein